MSYRKTIIKLDPSKIYYLAHPCTTGGVSIQENRRREESLYQFLKKQNPNVSFIRPLQIIPDNMPDHICMPRCFGLIDASDVIILPPGWQKSIGCTSEHQHSLSTQKGILLLEHY